MVGALLRESGKTLCCKIEVVRDDHSVINKSSNRVQEREKFPEFLLTPPINRSAVSVSFFLVLFVLSQS
jgi:hypothetical protein